jgi:hypothetical protein
MNLSKREFSEVLVRFSGVVCGFFAIIKLIRFIAATVAIFFVFPDELKERAQASYTMYTYFNATTHFIVLALLAFYLLRRGQRLINFLCRDIKS